MAADGFYMKFSSKHATVSLSVFMFYGFYIILTIVKGMGLYEGMTLYNVGLAVAFGCLAVKLLSDSYCPGQLILMMGALILEILTWRISGKMGALFNLALLAGMRGINREKLFRISAVLWSMLFSLQCFLTMSGLRKEQIFRIHRKLGTYLVRWSMGFTHPNVLHITYFVLLIFLMYVRKPRGKRLLVWSALAMAGNVVIFLYSVSYTGVALVTLYLLMNGILLSRRAGNRAFAGILQVLTYLLPAACIVFAVAGPILLQGELFDLVNRILSTRLELSRQYLCGQGIHLLGSGNMEVMDATITVDSSYVYMLVHYGLLYFLLFAVLLEMAVIHYWREKNFDAVAVLLACAVSGVTEQYMANTSFKNAAMLLIAGVIYENGRKGAFSCRDVFAFPLAEKKVRIPFLLTGEQAFSGIRLRFRQKKTRIAAAAGILFCAGTFGYLLTVAKPSAVYASPWDCDRKEGAAGEAYVYDYDLVADPDFNGWILSNNDALGKLYDFEGITATSEYCRRAAGRGMALVILFLWAECGAAVVTQYRKSAAAERKKIRVLMLVNWKVKYCDTIPEGIQPPDYVVKEQPYWFFRFMRPEFEVDVVDISAPHRVEKLEKKIRFYIWQTLRVLPRLNQYDLVLSHGMQSGIVLALWRRIFEKGSYRHVVFDIGAFNSGRRSGRALQLMQAASKSLDGVIYHTKIQDEYYEACHPWLKGKVKFIPFGTDADFFAEKGSSFSQEGGYILSFGKIKRDWDTLLKAYECSDRKLFLKVVGNTELSSEDPRVQILPPVSLDRLKELIRGAAFCVVPLEVLPYSYGQMTLLQQMAMGKAVIAADVPSLAAYHEGDGVCWYSPGETDELAQKMNEFAENPELCSEYGRRAEEAVRTRYNEEKMAEEIQAFLLDILKIRKEA